MRRKDEFMVELLGFNPFPFLPMQCNTAPLSFADLALRTHKITRTGVLLERMNKSVELSFTKQWHAELHPSDRGRKPFDAGVLFRVILLQQLFGLSDPQAEEQIYDRQSFQKFLGITANTDIPDETTICRFRKVLMEKGWDKTFFIEVERQLQEHGIIVTSGKSVDATISEVPKGRKREDGTSTRDPEASFTKKNNRTYHGYKGHMSTDTKGKFIQKVFTSTAKDHDSIHENKVLDGTENAVFEDSAYINKEKKKQFRKEGIFYGVVERATRGHPLSSSQKKHNRKLSSVRCRVEHPFAEMKCRMRFYLRYRGLRKADWQFTMVSAVYNLKRFIGQLFPAQAQAVVWRG
jgi:IS5 family transposase